MKTKLLLFSLIIGIIIGINYITNPQQPKNLKELLKQLQKQSAIGTKEDPHARANYELRMLRNPATGKLPTNIREKELSFAKTIPTKEHFTKLGKSTTTLTSNWAHRGPYNVGGRTRALAIDIANANTILAGGVSGGMWRSTNGGTSWTKTTTATQLHSVTCVAQDTRTGKTNTWYYGTGEFSGNSANSSGAFFAGDGIFKSTNNGISWQQIPSTVSNTPQTFDNAFDYIHNLAIDPSNTLQEEIYVATVTAIKRSVDGGNSWTTVRGNVGNNGASFTDVAVAPNGIVYATLSSSALDGSDNAVDRGIWKSPDGITWTNITQNFSTIYNRVVIGISPSNPNIVYFLAETPGSGTNGHSLWKYNNSNNTWENRSANIPMFGGFGNIGDFNSQGSYDLIIKVKPDNDNVLFIGGTNLYRSTDGFATNDNTKWVGGYDKSGQSYARYENHHPDQHALVFSPTNANTLFSGNDGGVQKTTNALADSIGWTPLNNGYSTGQFYTIAMEHSTAGDNLLFGGLQDNGTWGINSTNSQSEWIEFFSGDGAFCAVANNKSSYYFSSQGGNAYRGVLNTQLQLTDIANIQPSGFNGTYMFINPFALDPNNDKMMYWIADKTLWRNSDLTGIPTWQQIGDNAIINKTSINWTNLTNTATTNPISAVAVSNQPANRVYYGTSDGKLYRLDNAHTGNPIPTDIGTNKGFPNGAYINNIAINPTNADNAIVVFSNYEVVSLYSTTNGGTSWTPIAGNLEQSVDGAGNGPSCRWAAIVPFGGTTNYFVGTSTGLYSTTQLNGNSTTWVQEGQNTIGNVVVIMIDFRTVDGAIAVATHGNGVYSTNVTTPVKNGNPITPKEFSLSQNYPNPFNPTTTIRYTLPEKGKVTLRILDITGKEVATLINKEQEQGEYSTNWNAQTLASGTYLYELFFEGKSGLQKKDVKKMVLVK